MANLAPIEWNRPSQTVTTATIDGLEYRIALRNIREGFALRPVQSVSFFSERERTWIFCGEFETLAEAQEHVAKMTGRK